MPTPDKKLPFGKHKGMTLRQCPTNYLQWMAEHLRQSDFHEWALAAEQALKSKKPREQHAEDLEHAADDFLKQHGVDPKHPDR